MGKIALKIVVPEIEILIVGKCLQGKCDKAQTRKKLSKAYFAVHTGEGLSHLLCTSAAP